MKKNNCFMMTEDNTVKGCFIITGKEKRGKLEELKKKSEGLIKTSRKALITGATIIGISLYSGPALPEKIHPPPAPLRSSFKEDPNNFHIQNINNHKGRIILATGTDFEQIYEFCEGMARVRVGGKYGYINEWGNISIAPQFEDALNFSEGLAGIKINNKWGYISKAGKTIIQPQFDGAGIFSEGLAYVIIENKYGYIDKTGKIIIKPEFDKASDFSEGQALVEVEGKYAYIDNTGKYITFGDIKPVENIEATPTPQTVCPGGCVQACTVYTGCSGCVKCTGCTICTACTGLCTGGCTGCVMCTYCTGNTCGYCVSGTCGYCVGYTGSY